MILLVALFGAAFLTALLAWPLRVWLISRGVVDVPGLRRSHRMATPRGGGLAMAAAMIAALWQTSGPGAETLLLSMVTMALAALGWADDVRDLAVRWRLLLQLLIAGGMLLFTGPVESILVGSVSLPWPWLWSALALLAAVWLINLHNFMDGSDGLTAMQGFWSGLALGALFYRHGLMTPTLVGFVLAGACLGFLWWNRPPARLFMGDSGSMTVGGLIALLALIGAADGRVSIWLSLIVCSLFVVDATATLLQRAARGVRWYTPHREHAYQRLMTSGWSHSRVLGLYSMINLLVVLPVLLLAVRNPAWEAWLALGLITMLSAAWWIVLSATTKEHGLE